MPHSKGASMESNSVPKVIDVAVESLVNRESIVPMLVENLSD